MSVAVEFLINLHAVDKFQGYFFQIRHNPSHNPLQIYWGWKSNNSQWSLHIQLHRVCVITQQLLKKQAVGYRSEEEKYAWFFLYQ